MGSMRSCVLTLAFIAIAGCATYDEQLREARAAYQQGRYAECSAKLEQLKSEHQEWSTLFDLELGAVKFTAGEYEASSQALEAADQTLEVLDFTSDPSELGKYLFSESMGVFRARPYEKVFLSVLNLLNYAVRGKLAQARTESNLLYSKVDGIRQLQNTTRYDSALVYLLVGILDEIAEPNRPDQALIAYEKAYETLPLRSLKATIGKLRARRDSSPVPAGVAATGPPRGELIAFILNGRGPILQQSGVLPLAPDQVQFIRESLVAQIFANASASSSDQPVSEQDVRTFVYAKPVPVVKMAVMEPQPSAFTEAELAVSGTEPSRCEKVLDLERQVMGWFESVRGTILAAAITRTIFRVAASLTTEFMLQKKSGKDSAALFGALVFFTLQELDTPDTRCWSFIPRDVFYKRRVLDEGTYELTVTLRGPSGIEKRLPPKQATVTPGGFTFVAWVCHD